MNEQNQGLEGLASATNFKHFIEKIYLPVAKPLMASTTYDRSDGVFRNYLLPAFGDLALRDLTTLTLQSYFSKMASGSLTQESRDKIRDVPLFGNELRSGEWIDGSESRRTSTHSTRSTRAAP